MGTGTAVAWDAGRRTRGIVKSGISLSRVPTPEVGHLLLCLLRWVLSAIALVLIAKIVPGIDTIFGAVIPVVTDRLEKRPVRST